MLLEIFLDLCFGFVLINSEDALVHLKWMNSSLPKHWAIYVEKYLELSLGSNLTRKPFLISSLYAAHVQSCNFKMTFLKTILIPKCELCNNCNFGGMLVILPTYKTGFAGKWMICKHWPEWDWWKWQFGLHSLLRLNLTFHEFKLRDVFGFWLETKVSISSPETKEQYSFGGIKSRFSIYPFGRKIEISLKIKVYKPQDSLFRYSAVVISQRLLANAAVQQKHQNFLLVSCHNIMVRDVTVSTFSVAVEKYQIIHFHFSDFQQHSMDFVLFHGPGFYSQRSPFFDQKRTNVYVLNTFLCVLQAVMHRSSGDSGILMQDHVKYHGKDLFCTTIKVNNITPVKKFDFDSGKLSKRSRNCQLVFLVHSLPETVVNISIVQFHFVGQSENKCNLVEFQFMTQ